MKTYGHKNILNTVNHLQFRPFLARGGKGYKSFIIIFCREYLFIHFDHVSLTKLHQQCQEDPQRDLKGLPDVVVVEGQDGESLFVRSGVSWMVGALVPLRALISQRRVVSRSCSTTRRGKGNQEEQHNPRSERHTRTGAPPQHGHFQMAGRPNSRCSTLDPVVMRSRGGREASAVRHGGARTFTHKLPSHITHSSRNNEATFSDKDERSAVICRHRCWLTSRVRLARCWLFWTPDVLRRRRITKPVVHSPGAHRWTGRSIPHTEMSHAEVSAVKCSCQRLAKVTSAGEEDHNDQHNK